MAAHRKSIIKESLDRLESKMAIGQSRHEAKRARRQEQGLAWSVPTGQIHSFKTRSVYQEHVLSFVTWVRSTYGIKRLDELDARAGELATAWLQRQLAEGKSPSTLQVERSALRLFFADRTLASAVVLPRRTREAITRSRGPKAHDRHFQPANWQPLLAFLRATGLRRQELRDLRCGDIFRGPGGQVCVHVRSGKGGRERFVEVLPGHDQEVWCLKEGRADGEQVVDRIPKHLDVHSSRREFAQALYLHYAPGWSLPPTDRRLRPSDYDHAAAERVSWALGHNRIDVVHRHYLR